MSRNKTIILILAFLFIVGALSSELGRETSDEETPESGGSETEPEPEPEPEPKEPEWHLFQAWKIQDRKLYASMLPVEKGDRIKIVLLGDYYNMAEILITCNDESYKYYKMYKLSHELIVDITEEGEYKIGILLDGSAAKYRVYRWE